MLQDIQDQFFMQMALREAQAAFEQDEVPVGAVMVCANKVIAKGRNQVELLQDVTAHAEILALTSSSAFLASKYLPECTLYVTLEPCLMCASALYWAHLGRLVYGASDAKRGFSIIDAQILHPKTEVSSGIMETECSELLSRFFQSKR